MAYNITNTLDILSNKNNVTSEDILEAMYLLYREVLKISQTDSLGKTVIKSKEKYASNLYNLLWALESTYASSEGKRCLAELDMSDVDGEISNTENLVENLKNTVSKLNEKLIHLENIKSEKNAISEKREHLDGEIEILESELMKLDSVNIGKLEKTKDDLENELNKKRSIESKLNTLSAELLVTKENIVDLEKKVENMEKERTAEESRYRGLSERLLDYQKWKENYDENMKNFGQSSVESESTFSAISNAWNSISINPDVVKILSNNTSTENSPSTEKDCVSDEISSFTDINKWFTDMNSNIETLLNLYIEKYRSVVQTVEKATGGGEK